MLTKYTTVNIIYDAGVDRVLMIRKRRNANGFGSNGRLWKDKYNFPGGKLEKGETFTEGVIRETIEETGLIPFDLDMKGLINFKGLDMLIKNAVFLTKRWDGNLLSETEEATVEWVKRADIPFDKMFPSDKLWVPEVFKPIYFMTDVANSEVNGQMAQKLENYKEVAKMPMKVLKERVK